MGTAKTLVLEKLTESGLTAADARALKFEALDATATAALGTSFQKLPSLYIPYLTPEGKPASAMANSSAVVDFPSFGCPPNATRSRRSVAQDPFPSHTI